MSIFKIFSRKSGVRYTTFGLTAQADLQAKKITFEGTRVSFKVLYHGTPLGTIHLNLSGRHNISNALAAIAAGLEVNIPFNTIKCALEKIEGVKRRMELKGKIHGITVMDDYGHHPTEIKTTLRAIRERLAGQAPGGRISTPSLYKNKGIV